MKSELKVLILLNTAWNVVNFRSGLIRDLISNGYDVVTVAPHDAHVKMIEELGARHVNVEMDRHGKCPFKDLRLLWDIHNILRSECPDVVLTYTIKPNIYGAIAARTLKIPVICNVAGLGSTFLSADFTAKLVRTLYRFAFLGAEKVFFQNRDDLELFVGGQIVRTDQTDLLPGSGVDLDHFAPVEILCDKDSERVRFLFVGRLLSQKGIGEFVEAGRLLRDRFPHAELCVLGFMDERSPGGISMATLDQWVDDGLVIYLGATSDVRPHLAAADCVVLPSYYPEGTPRSLLEAAAMAKPVITTDEPGCRSVVEHGVNGFLCESRNPADLCQKMEDFMNCTNEERMKLGQNSRSKISREFDQRDVIYKYNLEISSAILKRNSNLME